ncbi:hypothetical protein GCM10010123_08380 [Pilimelia anulata]|uniref:DUF4360 domain-containing protein n=1 Tax=Pilimelia anulata TaxID=53371 RepID=A0A8J3AZV6_9ACTN|nr:DUF4360 domain-containing protein [Pilimelia anulata]GGJ80793.1 hypothetical protein GCM10010123_08380 [Pilimelia anulata]
MSTRNRVAAATLIAACTVPLAAPPATAAPEPRRGPVGVELVAVSGSGCDKDSTSVIVDPTGGGLTALYRDFTARTPHSPAIVACTLVLRLTAAEGHRVGLRRVAYSGEATLRPGATAQFKSKYFWQGDSRTLELPGWRGEGPYDGSWQAAHTLDDFWGSRCGGLDQLIITQNIRASGPGGNRIDVGYGALWDLVTQPC